MMREKSIYLPIFILNGVILCVLFTISSLIAGLAYNLLKIVVGRYSNLLSILILLICLMLCYLLFVLLIALYYRSLLATISEKETTLNLQEKGNARARQILRFVLSGVAADIALPILFYFPASLKLFGAKIGKDPLIRARIINPELMETGNNVLIGDGSLVITHLRDGDRLVYKRIKIGHNCTIGVRSVLFPGVEIGNNSMVGAYSLIPKNTIIPPNEVWVGIPARKIGDVNHQ